MDRFDVATARLKFSMLAAFAFTAFLHSLDRHARPNDVVNLFFPSTLTIFAMCTLSESASPTTMWSAVIPHQPVTRRRTSVNYDLRESDLDG